VPGPNAVVSARRVTRRLCVAALVAAASLGPAWPSAAETLRVGAASSLREAADASARSFEALHPEVEVEVSYGASSVLAAQLRAGAPLDVLLSADAALAAELHRADIVRTPRVFARNRLVVVARRDLAPFISAADLAGPGLRRIAVPHAAVPVGRYARGWLEDRGLLEALLPRLVATEHARATLIAVDQGHVDAAIVYATDAALARRARVVWEIPPGEQPEILYAAAVAHDARDAALGDAFVALLTSGAGREHLVRARFAPGPTP
jgi:molybdate transport system substrate-binding protein